MGYSFGFDAGNKVFRCTWQGQISDRILLEGYAAMGKLLASRRPCRGLQDFTEVTAGEISSETINELSRMPPIYGTDSTVVFVALKDLHYGLLRQFSILGDGNLPNLHIVRTMEEAYRLLNLDGPQFTHVEIE